MIKPSWCIKVDGRGKSSDEIFNSILKSRGIDLTSYKDFIEPSTYWLHPSNAFRNIEQASEIFIHGIGEGKKFFIYADVDTDGCTSAAIIYHYLSAFDIHTDVYINKGKVHGITDDFDFSVVSDTDIIIVVDSLNPTKEQYHKLLCMGKQLIVLDHHLPTNEILEIEKSINLVSSALDDYPNHELSGSGVCWKFLQYVDRKLGKSISDDLVDLASIGIIADVSDVGESSMENRAICHLGFNNIKNVAVQELLKKDTMTSTDISFGIAPLVNASNRMGSNDKALRLFLSTDPKEVKYIIDFISADRDTQRLDVKKLFPIIEQQYENQKGYNFYVFYVKDCGTLSGLLATQAVSKYGKPCIVLSGEDDTNMYGSMRAKGVDNFSAIVNESNMAQCLGHENSAGIFIKKETFLDFLSFMDTKLLGVTFETSIDVDVVVDKSQLTKFLLDKIAKLNRISGHGFGKVLILLEDMSDCVITHLSGGKHLCIKSKGMKFLQWNVGNWDSVVDNGILSAVGTVEESVYFGNKSLQMIMEDYTMTPKVKPLW